MKIFRTFRNYSMKIKIIIFLITFSCFKYVLAASPIPVTSHNGMVVSAQYLASQVGSDILEKGGNAIDAAVAVGYALAVVEPQCGNIGGGGFMLVHLKDGKNIFLDFRESAPSHLTYDKYYKILFDKNDKTILRRYLSSGTPGTVMGLNTALEKYGTMPLSEVIKPAVSLAKTGFPVYQTFLDKVDLHLKDFREQHDVSEIFLEKDNPLPMRSVLKQKTLAKTLKEIGVHGTSAFYQGNIAKNIVKTYQRNGGLITLDDLKNYKAIIREPLVCEYKGYTIVTGQPPSSGVTVCEILKAENKFTNPERDFHSFEEISHNVETMNLAYADRKKYIGSYDESYMNVPLLLSEKHIDFLYSKINAGKNKLQLSNGEEKFETTHYSVMDKWGNAVSITYTLNGYFGNTIMPEGTGFFMNNELLDFNNTNFGPNSLAPNKRPLSSISPIFVIKDNQVVYVLGTPGGETIISQMVEVIQNLIDYHMNISQAVNSCRYHVGTSQIIYQEPYCFSEDTIKLLNNRGYKIETGFRAYNEDYWGGVAGISFDPAMHIYYGSMDVRRPDGAAVGPPN